MSTVVPGLVVASRIGGSQAKLAGFQEGTVRRLVDPNSLDEFVERSKARPGMWETDSYRAYVAALDDYSTLPQRLHGLEAGRHQIEHDGEPTEIQVEDRGQLCHMVTRCYLRHHTTIRTVLGYLGIDSV